MEKIKNWFIWRLIGSPIGAMFLLFFGTFFAIAFFSERKENRSDVHVMKEDVIYVRPVGFEEKEVNDSSNLELK